MTSPIYLLDTNIFIAGMKKNPNVLARLAQIPPSQLRLSVIVLGELKFGAKKSQYQQKNLANLQRLTENIELVPINLVVIEKYATVRQNLESQGKKICSNDTWIASQALAINAIMVTDNMGEFQRVENLTIENWLNP